jgi:hypothetical protein
VAQLIPIAVKLLQDAALYRIEAVAFFKEVNLGVERELYLLAPRPRDDRGRHFITLASRFGIVRLLKDLVPLRQYPLHHRVARQKDLNVAEHQHFCGVIQQDEGQASVSRGVALNERLGFLKLPTVQLSSG